MLLKLMKSELGNALKIFRLDCQPTQGLTPSCPAAKCGDLFLGNTSTSATSTCDSTTCSYAGYTNGTSFSILANLTTSSVCNGER